MPLWWLCMKHSLEVRQVRLCAPPLEPLMTSKGTRDQGCMLAAEDRYNPATLHWMMAPRAALQSGFRVLGIRVAPVLVVCVAWQRRHGALVAGAG